MQELVDEIVGDRNTDTVILNMMDVYSAINTKNDNNYCAKGLGFDSLILVNDTVFDKETKDKVVEFEGRIKEIFDARNDKVEFNKLLNKLLMEVLTATEEEFISGRVWYYLQKNTDDGIWGQDLKTSESDTEYDKYPVLGGQKVYISTLCPTEYSWR